MVTYPYIPEGVVIKYVLIDNPYMQAAREHARKASLDKLMPNSSVLTKDNQIIGRGANGSNYHDAFGCERVKQGIPTGQSYELCEGCHPKNHSEPKAIADAREQGHNPKGADLYLWGHWWCCEPCWNAMQEAGVRQVYLLEKSEKLFNKEHSENIVGKQFA